LGFTLGPTRVAHAKRAQPSERGTILFHEAGDRDEPPQPNVSADSEPWYHAWKLADGSVRSSTPSTTSTRSRRAP
jgi:hypothetical protein